MELTHTVLAHRATLDSIIANLISNAVEFVEPGAAPEVRLRAEEREGFVRLWVEDNGFGIEPRHQTQIFIFLAGRSRAVHRRAHERRERS